MQSDGVVGAGWSASLHFTRVRPLGSGGLSEAWEGCDERTGERVVLRRVALDGLDGATRAVLYQQATLLQRYEGEGRLVHLETSPGDILLVTRWVDGTPLSGIGPLDRERALHLAERMFEALGAFHDLGLIHLDLKPANIIVKPDDSVALIDFGLGGVLPGACPVGTARYMSPEQAGMIRRDIGPAADLYSAGAVLHEMLTGRVPYDGETASEVLRRHVSAPLPRLPDAVPGLEHVVHGLLQKDPADRYAAAWEVAEELRRIRRGEGVSRAPRGLQAPDFVGRAAEMGALLGALDSAVPYVEIHAPSGMGKSRLLEEVGLRAWRRGALVLEASPPTVGGFMLEAVARQALERGALRGVDLAAADAAALARLLPPLRGWLGGVAEREDEPSTDEVVGALTRFLQALSSSRRQVVVLLDDCQEADPLTLRVLREWPAGGRAGGTVVVAAWRDDAGGGVHLGPLSRGEIKALVSHMLGAAPEALVDFVEKAAGGSPFLAIEAVRGLVGEGVVALQEGGLTVRAERLSSAAVSDRGAAFLARRVDGLTPAARDILSLGALLGRTFSIPVIVAISDLSVDTAVGAAEEARALALVRSDGRLRYAFQHDRIREGLIEDMAADVRQALHLRIARMMEVEGDPAALCFHLERGGQVERCVEPALAAAKEARGRRDYEAAAQYLRLARRGLGGGDPRRGGVLEALGDVLLKLGLRDEADACVREALAECGDAIGRARLLLRLGRRRRHEMSVDGRELVEEALAQTGHPAPSTAREAMVGLVAEIAKQVVSSWLPSTRPEKDRERDLLAADLCYELAIMRQLANDIPTTLWATFKQLNLAGAHPPSPQLGLALSEHVALLAMMPSVLHGRAERCAARAMAIATESGHPLLQGGLCGRLGFLRVNQGRVAEARRLMSEAVALVARHFDRFERHAAGLWMGYVECMTGDVEDGIARLQEVADECWRAGNRLTSSTAAALLAFFNGGRIEREVFERELALPATQPLVEPQALRSRGWWKMGRNDLAEGAADFESAQEQGGPLRLVADMGQAWRATAQRLAAASLPLEAREVRQRHLTLARRAARAAAGGLPVVRPHGLREAALLAVEKGHPYRARALFAESLSLARSQGNRYDEAWTLYERGRAGRWLRWPEAEADLREGRAMLAEMRLDASGGRPVPIGPLQPSPLGVADRLSDAIGAGRALAASLDADGVLAATHEAALRLLRAQDGVVLVSRGEAWVRACGSSIRYSSSVVRQAARERAVVTVEEAPAASATDSLILGGVRSVLAAPLIARDEVAAVVYVVHSQVAGLFAEEEVRLAEFLAAIAGAALENAMGFREIRTLSATVEGERARLQRALEEKQVMLAEIHHRVRNNLQLVASLLRLEKERAGPAEAVIDELLGRVEAMGSLQDLMYEADDYASVPMETYLQAVIAHARGAFGVSTEVSLSVEEGLLMPVGRALPCGLLVNELVSNSVRHASARRVQVRAEARRIVVEDDGVGLPADLDPETAASTGLTIVRALAGQLGGTVRWEGPGTRVSVNC